MPAPIVSCENIHKTYLLGVEGVAALRGVAVDVFPGELLVVYGTSGGGKSTLLNILGTIDTPTKGNLVLFGQRVTDHSSDVLLASMRSKKVGFVFQSFNLLSTMTAVENVSLPMILLGERSAQEIETRAVQLLKDVGLGHRLEHYPSMLSGGEQQRVTIARALANEPEMLLLDEPTGDLDTRNCDIVMNILLNLNKQRQLTMVMVTHDVYMKQYAHRVIYLRDGKIFAEETINEAVRHRALEDLQENVRLGTTSNAAAAASVRNTPEILRRAPEDYATFSAQSRYEPNEDDEMQDIVDLLFTSNRT